MSERCRDGQRRLLASDGRGVSVAADSLDERGALKLRVMTMIERRIAKCAIILIALAACSSRSLAQDESALDLPQGYIRTGVTEICVSVEDVAAITVVNEKALLVYGEDNVYLNVLDDSCVDLSREVKRIEYLTKDSEVCRDDLIKIVGGEAGELLGSCRLGDFEALLKTQAGPAHNVSN